MPLGGRSSQLIDPGFHTAVQGSAVGERGMPDLCTITRAGSGTGTTDPDTGDWTPPDLLTTVYDDPETAGAGAPCRAQATNQAEQTVVVGEDIVTLHPYMVAVPATVDQVLVDDVVHITASTDPYLQGRDLIVRSVHHSSFLARRLLLCDDHPDNPTEAA